MAVEVGETEYGSGDPICRETAFPIGSITKAFTATVAMVLVADSDLSLDVPVGEYIPELGYGNDSCGGITVRQLLSHTGGLAAGPDAASTASMRRYALDHCRQSNLVLPPATAFSYSNLGYVLIGHLIEMITGMSWWEATALILLKPLDIAPTFIAAPRAFALERPVATGHSVNRVSGRTVPVQQNEPLAEAATGSLAVSAVDLVSLGLMHVDLGLPEVLPTRYAELMRQAVPGVDPFGLADGWGLGLAVFRDSATEWVGHDGNADGTSCYLRIDPTGGCVVALTSNANIGVHLWNDLVTELRRANVRIAHHAPQARLGVPGPRARPVVPPAGCIGSYFNGDDDYQIVTKDGHLGLAVDGEIFARLVFVDESSFSLHDLASGERIQVGRLLRDPTSGEIAGIHTLGRFARRRVPAAAEVGRC